MKLESQVCSLELAKRLKELNCKQESLWWWYKNPRTQYKIGLSHSEYIFELLPHSLIALAKTSYKRYSAFTVAELGEMLPSWNEEKGNYEKLHPKTTSTKK